VSNWVEVCGADDVEAEDVIPVEIRGGEYAIYRSPDDDYFATDGRCTHQRVLLADGLVMDNIIECPKHNGRFDYTTGAGQCAPITRDLTTYPVKVEAGVVYVDLPEVQP